MSAACSTCSSSTASVLAIIPMIAVTKAIAITIAEGLANAATAEHDS